MVAIFTLTAFSELADLSVDVITHTVPHDSLRAGASRPLLPPPPSLLAPLALPLCCDISLSLPLSASLDELQTDEGKEAEIKAEN